MVILHAGFRITACAATPDQAAFVLSVPRRRPMDETQETLRTSAFPSTHVKDKCALPCCVLPCNARFNQGTLETPLLALL